MPHIDIEACTRRGVVVCAGTGSPYAPAELTLALILASTRNLVAETDALRSGAWQATIGRELHGRTLGIVGYGTIGALVATYGGALGMRVLAWGRAGSLERAQAFAQVDAFAAGAPVGVVNPEALSAVAARPGDRWRPA